MKITAFSNLSLPKLAWVAEVDCESEIVALFHGSSVEIRKTFFIEGVWNGSFRAGEFAETDCIFGTGAILDAGVIRFVSSASTVDSLYYAERDRHVIVSNSLPLLLGYVGDSLDPRYQEYPKICDSIMRGINHYRRDIPTIKGKVRRQLYRNLSVGRGGVVEYEKRLSPRFGSFTEYYTYLRNNYALIVANARDSSRIEPLEILSTQSTGYDTTAVNALGRTFGIDKVFTVTRAKSIGRLAHQEEDALPNDDGSEICKTLGLPCISIDRRAFTEGFQEEHLFYSAIFHNQDVNMLEIGRCVARPSMLVTGHGGAVWYPVSSRAELLGEEQPGSELNATDSGGLGLTEFRLARGFIHLPLPHIGARRKRDIQQITDSAEMDPWRLGRLYDRPIARRIAEDAGVPRGLFGQTKKGSVVIFSQPAIPYSNELRSEFFQYLEDEALLSRLATLFWPLVRWVNSILMTNSHQRYRVVYYAERVVSKLISRRFRFRRVWSRLDGALYCFCVGRTSRIYAEQLKIGQDGESRMTVNKVVAP